MSGKWACHKKIEPQNQISTDFVGSSQFIFAVKSMDNMPNTSEYSIPAWVWMNYSITSLRLFFVDVPLPIQKYHDYSHGNDNFHKIIALALNLQLTCWPCPCLRPKQWTFGALINIRRRRTSGQRAEWFQNIPSALYVGLWLEVRRSIVIQLVELGKIGKEI